MMTFLQAGFLAGSFASSIATWITVYHGVLPALNEIKTKLKDNTP